MTRLVKSNESQARGGALSAGGLTAFLLVALGAFVALAIFTTSSRSDVSWLGMEIEPLSTEMRRSLGVPAGIGGVYVSDVVGLAAASGVREGDVIVGINGQLVTGLSDVRELRAAAPAGLPVALEINRGGQVLTTSVAEGGAVAAGSGLPVALPPGCATCPGAGGLPVALPPGCATCPNARLAAGAPGWVGGLVPAAGAGTLAPETWSAIGGAGGLQAGFARGGVACPLR